MKSIELFAGIGGIALAAEWAGIETVAFCEQNEFCQQVIAKNFQNPPIYEDVYDLTKDRLIALGNAVVPQQIYPIFKAIVDISNRA